MNYSSCCLYSYTQALAQIDTIYLKKKKVVDVNRNGLVKLLFVSIYKKTLFVVVILTLTYKHC